VDSIARVNYKHFGEVVSFDATHNTNQYGLIFVPLVEMEIFLKMKPNKILHLGLELV